MLCIGWGVDGSPKAVYEAFIEKNDRSDHFYDYYLSLYHEFTVIDSGYREKSYQKRLA